jgi:hypothetical protein
MNITVKENARIGEKYYYMKHRSGLDIYVIPKKLTSAYALFCTRYGAVDNCFRLEGEADFSWRASAAEIPYAPLLDAGDAIAIHYIDGHAGLYWTDVYELEVRPGNE